MQQPDHPEHGEDAKHPPAPPPMPWILIGSVLVVSGLCSLVYQVAWLRLLRLIFGASTAASAAVVAIFMGGLGLGGYLFGRRVRRTPRPLEFYARLELGIALTAAASPFLVALARWLYVALGGVHGLGMFPATLLRLVLSTVVIGFSTTLMGGTLPAVAQAFERGADRSRRYIAWFYGLNTLGAVAGAFLTTFFLLELLGIRQTLWITSLVNLLLVVVVRSMARRPPFALQEAPDPGPAASAAAEAQQTFEEPPPSRATVRLVLVSAAMVGFLFFLMELVWYRMLAPVLGGSSYTFGLILSLALLGIGIGGLIYAAGSHQRRLTFHALALTCALEALFLVLPFALGDSLAAAAAATRALSALGFGGLVASWSLVAGVVVVPPAIVAGYQFPLLVSLLGSDRRRAGYEVGVIYAWNTWGAILGSLAGGFGLLPLLTAPRLWRFSALLLMALGAVAALVAMKQRRQPAALVATLLCITFGLALASRPGPTAFWRHTPIGAGRVEIHFDDPNGLRRAFHSARNSVLHEADGVESSVALVVENDLSLVVNGKSDGAARGDAATTVMGGLTGALLHPDPRVSLVIGLGTGATAGWMAQVPSMQRVDVVELEPAVVDFASEIAAINLDVLESRKVEIFYGDGREYVLTTDTTYDIIFSEPSNPYRAGVADLFSQDFYRAVSLRLGEDGIFLQWLQGYEIDAELVQTVLTTLSTVFPHLELWQTHATDLLVLAATQPLVHDLDQVRARVAEQPFRDALRWVWHVEGVEGLYTGFIAGDRLVRALAQTPAPRISTDDRPLVEFGFARNVGRSGLLRLQSLQSIALRLDAHRPVTTGAPIDWSLVEERRHTRAVLGTAAYNGAIVAAAEPDLRHRLAAREAYGKGNLKAAGDSWLRQPEEPATFLDGLLLAEALADRGDTRAESWVDAMRAELPIETEALLARLRWRQGDAAAAAQHLLQLFELCQRDAVFFGPLVQRSFALAVPAAGTAPEWAEPLYRALETPFAARYRDGDRLVLRMDIAARLEDPTLCVSALAPFEPHPVWERSFLEARLRCYEQAGHPLAAKARVAVQEFMEVSPPRFVVGLPAQATGP